MRMSDWSSDGCSSDLICPNVTPNVKRMIGAEIKLGWTLQVRKALGGVEGCTHLVDLLIAMATVAFQTLYPVRPAKAAQRKPGERPSLLETCHAFATDSPLVKRPRSDEHTPELQSLMRTSYAAHRLT